ncbi:MAG TPA: amidohydrolase family protein [Terriglobales bacterium]|nr:amidohydrolase family protein [Terriglobales bacterium]
MGKRLFALCVLACAAWAQTAPVTPAAKPITYIKAGRLFDATNETVKTNMVIVVAGDRIQMIGTAAEIAIPANANLVDLSKATVLPGLIDLHTHLSARADRYDEIYNFKDTPFHNAFAAVINARKTLAAGFTTVRDLGGPPFLAVDLRNSINEGFIPGPRIVAAGPGISITGGHGDLNNYAPQVRVMMFPEERDYGIADGVDEVRKTVRAQVKYGVDAIKILATGGVLSRGTNPGAPQYTFEELKAAADEAHSHGRTIAAHAHGAQGIKNAILAGIDTIEHCSFIDDEGIRLAKERGTYLDFDIYNDDYILGKAIEFKIPQEFVDKEKVVGRTQRENFEKAFRAGAKMTFGTDAGVYPHGDNAKQFFYMVKFGMRPAQALIAATAVSAAAVKREKDIGTLEAGKFADIIAVDSDPLKDVTAMEKVTFVMKGGKVFKEGGIVKE